MWVCETATSHRQSFCSSSFNLIRPAFVAGRVVKLRPGFQNPNPTFFNSKHQAINMAKRKKAATLPNNLALLINLIKRDPASYLEEFHMQHRHYQSQRDIFMVNPHNNESQAFAELIGFVAQAAQMYPDETKEFPNEMESLLGSHHAVLDYELKQKIVQSSVLLRNRNILSPAKLLKSLFPLLVSTDSKDFRAQLYKTIISDIRSANRKTKNQALNRSAQAILFDALSDPTDSSIWAVRIAQELWRRKVWDDARTVDILRIASLCRENPKVMCLGVYFFLGNDDKIEDESSSEEEVSAGQIKHQLGINKKKKSRQRLADKAISNIKKKAKSKGTAVPQNFSALHLLHDPQGFAEALFNFHLATVSKLKADEKLVVLKLVCRLVGTNKLSVLAIYSYLLKYVSPRQKDVTQYLACTAQACHEFVPPDLLETLVRKIADEFVSEGVAGEIACAGLNAIREICARAPLAMTPDLLEDLTMYKSSRDKGVMMAARGLLSLFREVAPSMLKRKDRGKNSFVDPDGKNVPRYGEEQGVSNKIEGLELLEAYDAGHQGETEKDGWENWDAESDEEEEDEGWENVSSNSDRDIVLSDSDDDTTVGTPKELRGLLPTEVDEEGKGSNYATTKVQVSRDSLM